MRKRERERERAPADREVRRRRRKEKGKQGQRKQHVQMCVRTHRCALAHICGFVPTKLRHIPRSNIYTLFATPYIMYYSLFSSNLEPEIRQIEINDYFSVSSNSPLNSTHSLPAHQNLTDGRASLRLKRNEFSSDLTEVCLRRQLWWVGCQLHEDSCQVFGLPVLFAEKQVDQYRGTR